MRDKIVKLKGSFINDTKTGWDLPGNATIRKEYVKRGKDSCQMSHGPYYYAYWKEKVSSNDNRRDHMKIEERYIGFYLPENVDQDKVGSS